MEKDIVSNPVIWSPSDERVKSSQMYKFMKNINEKYNINLDSFANLHSWSIENKSEFWSSIWDFFNIKGSKGIEPHIDPINQIPGSKFFPNGKVNYAENMLSGDVSGSAIVFKSEDKIRKEVTWRHLKVQVAALANFLKKQGIVKGDRVAAYMPNMPETVIMMLATSSLGAIFSSASPDFGVDGVLDRFGQIEPKILLTTDGYWYNGKEINITKKVIEVVEALPSLQKIVIAPLLGIEAESDIDKFVNYNDIQNEELINYCLSHPYLTLSELSKYDVNRSNYSTYPVKSDTHNFILQIRKEIFMSKKNNINIKELFNKLKKEVRYKKFSFLTY